MIPFCSAPHPCLNVPSPSCSSCCFLEFSPTTTLLTSLICLERKIKLSKATLGNMYSYTSPSPNLWKKCLLPSNISYQSSIHIISLLLLTHYDKKKKGHVKLKGLLVLYAGGLAEQNHSWYWGKGAGRERTPVVMGFLLFPFFSLEPSPRDSVTHIQGRPLSLSHLWKHLQRHT